MHLPGIVYDIGSVLGWTLLHFLWQGLVIALAYALTRHMLDSPRARHAAALTGLVACLAAPAVTFQRLWLASTGPAAALPAAAADNLAASGQQSGVVAAAGAGNSELWLALLAAAWLLGALVIGLRLLGDWRQLRRVIRDSLPAPQALSAILDRELARIGLRRPVRLRLTASYQVPGVYGLLRPVILMPVSLMLKLPADQIETLILHELAHVRRLDAIGNAIAIVARTLLYFHPLVHWLCRDLERHRETLCDELVMASPTDRIKYARAISAVAICQHSAPAPLLTASGGELTSRVHHILALGGRDTSRSQRGSYGPLLLALAAIAMTLPLLPRLDADSAALAIRPELRVATQVLAPALLLPTAELPAPVVPRLAPPASLLPVADSGAGIAEGSLAATSFTATAAATADGSGIAANAPGTAPTVAVATAASAGIDTPVRSDSGQVSSLDPIATASVLPLAGDVPAASAVAAASDAGAAVMAATEATGGLQADAVAGTDVAARNDERLAPAPARPELLHMVHPSYPRAARRAGTEGSVELSYRIDSRGEAVDIRVLASEPAGEFDSTAIAALSRWQFAADSEGGNYRQIFDFNLGQDAERCPITTGSRICRN
ncbi:MAG: M56 family metallopeptidase [Xanthomonadales bacterium]|nr:M56 family metallopeptidase [Xanthomonadales bacterium]